MSKDFIYILPSLQPPVTESFATYQTTRQFYQEVQARSEFQRYCQWYRQTARQHQQQLKRMRGEFNFMQWFRRQEFSK